MYAIVEIKGKQYKVEKGKSVDVDLINNLEDGGIFKDFKVLMIVDGDNVQIGTPYLENVNIEFQKQKDVKGPKIVVFKYKRRKNYKRKKGHRQKYTRLLVKDIQIG